MIHMRILQFQQLEELLVLRELEVWAELEQLVELVERVLLALQDMRVDSLV